MINQRCSYSDYINTYNGKALLKKYTLGTESIWHIKGEDPNCDLGGIHSQPSLGYIEGRLDDVIKVAVKMDSFWTWGSGGTITLHKEPIVKQASKVLADEFELKSLISKRDKINKRIEELGGE